MEMGLKKDKYYQVKRRAIYNLATALGIILRAVKNKKADSLESAIYYLIA